MIRKYIDIERYVDIKRSIITIMIKIETREIRLIQTRKKDLSRINQEMDEGIMLFRHKRLPKKKDTGLKAKTLK